MSKFIYDVRCPEIVWLGRREENISRTVYIRVESILKKFPDASFYLKAKRPTEDNWYIAKLENIKVVDGILEWIVSSADVGIAGLGELEVHATSGEAKQISVLFKTKIDKTMEGTGGEIPPDVDDIIDNVINAGNAANEAAKNANDAADKANTAATGANSAADRANLSADKADSSSLKADEAAKNANSAADRVDTSITNANNAADEAKRSAQSANDAAVTANGSAANADDAAKRANDAAANAEGIAENVGNAEAERVLAENERVSFETERKKSEESRVAAEDLRKTGEEARISAETVREQSENERKSAETGRVQAETQRILAEESRVSSESVRASAEEVRASAENIRNTAEQERIENEDTRKTSESGREEAELHRVTAEELRVKAEQDRETGFNTMDISVARGDKKATVKAVNPRGVETLADILDGKNTVAVSDTEPTDPDFDVWINPDAEMPEQYAKLSDVPKVDKTLSISGDAADAKFVGDIIVSLSRNTSSWITIRDLVRAGLGERCFPVGTQLKSKSTQFGEVIWDVVGHNVHKNPNDVNAPTMTLNMHRVISPRPFSCEEMTWVNDTTSVRSPGTYSFTLFNSAPGGAPYENGTYQFTLTSFIAPKGGWRHDGIGRARSDGDYNTPDDIIGKRITAYNFLRNPTESSVLVSHNPDSVGTNLGTCSAYSDNIINNTIEGRFNLSRCSGYGRNCYEVSTIRTYLNSNGDANQWWESRSLFDLPPKYANSPSFMYGFDPEFLSAVGEVDVISTYNENYNPNGTGEKSYVTRDKFFPLSKTEIGRGNNNGTHGEYPEGAVLPFYDGEGPGKRIKYNQSSSEEISCAYWLRSADLWDDSDTYEQYVDDNGYLDDAEPADTGATIGIAPACVIY